MSKKYITALCLTSLMTQSAMTQSLPASIETLVPSSSSTPMLREDPRILQRIEDIQKNEQK